MDSLEEDILEIYHNINASDIWTEVFSENDLIRGRLLYTDKPWIYCDQIELSNTSILVSCCNVPIQTIQILSLYIALYNKLGIQSDLLHIPNLILKLYVFTCFYKRFHCNTDKIVYFH